MKTIFYYYNSTGTLFLSYTASKKQQEVFHL